MRRLEGGGGASQPESQHGGKRREGLKIWQEESGRTQRSKNFWGKKGKFSSKLSDFNHWCAVDWRRKNQEPVFIRVK